MDDNTFKAASNGNVDDLQRIFAKEDPTEEALQEILALAAGNYDLEIQPRLHTIQYILQHHCPKQVPERALLKATFSGSSSLFSAFFIIYEPRSIINMHFERHGTPLVVACTFRKSVAFIKFLLENGADPNYRGDGEDWIMLPLNGVAAMWRDNAAEAEAVVDLLLEYGAKGWESALETARRRGNNAVERRILETVRVQESETCHWNERKGAIGGRK